MVKITKLSDLTDIEKLKQLGSSIVDPSKVSNLVDKVKSTVIEPGKMGDLVGKVKSSVGLGEKSKTTVESETNQDLQAQANVIQQSLQALFEAQKQQLAIMNTLRKQINNLVASAVAEPKEVEPINQSPAEPEVGTQSSKDNVPDDTV